MRESCKEPVPDSAIRVRRQAIAVVACVMVAVVGDARGQMRPPVGDRHALEVDGQIVFPLKSVEGGGVAAEVLVEPGAGGVAPKKRLGAPRYEDITMEVVLGMGKVLHEWISATWAGSGQPKSGSVVTGDFNMKAQSRRSFTNALITATTFPALDAASKDPGYLKVTISPEVIRVTPGQGEDLRGATMSKNPKMWVVSNFRFEMDGLDASRVYRIEPFSVRHRVTREKVGEFRTSSKAPVDIEFPNLTITLSESFADSWIKWHEDFVVNGNNGDDREKSGAIVLLGPDLKSEILRITLQNCGIFRLAPQRSEVVDTRGARVTAELYCERMQFAPAAGMVLGGNNSGEIASEES